MSALLVPVAASQLEHDAYVDELNLRHLQVLDHHVLLELVVDDYRDVDNLVDEEECEEVASSSSSSSSSSSQQWTRRRK